MESWCFDSLEKSYVSNETIAPRNVLLEWNMKSPYSCCESSNIQVVDNTSGYPAEDGIAEILARQFDRDNAPLQHEYSDVFRDQESESSKFGSSSVVDSDSRELSSLIDLKLGAVSDHNLKSNSSGEGAVLPVVLSAESSIPVKRARAVTSLSPQTAYCQVFGCNKDLSLAKDYHKRHKVCDVHSKTARVVVNGIEQRFCQQCSRFHLLAEFDDGKRSCRKRLAGHNQRRRKPQVGFGRNRSGRSLHSNSGSSSSKFQGTALAATSFICQDILGPSLNEKYPTNSWNKDIKIEDGASVYGHLGQKTVLPPYLFGRQYTSVLDNGVYTENMNQYPHETVSRSLFQTNLLGSEELTLYDTESGVQGIPGMSESGCALSLLSSQSHNSHSSNASVIQSSCPHFGMTQVYGSQGLTAKSFPNTLPMLDDGDVDFANGNVHGLSCDDRTTIDLLQLSSQIQHVENQRQTGPVKRDNRGFLLS